MRPRSAALWLALTACVSGCSLFAKKSPQQEYSEALMRGNSMQASQVWLNMSPEDRLKFARGEGIAPDTSTKKDVQQMLTNHYENQSGEGSSGGEQTEMQTPTPLGASLKQLQGADSSSTGNQVP